MKRILLGLLLLPLLIVAQVEKDEIIENEEISGTYTKTASNSIVIKPTTWIKSGANFTAKIVADGYLPLSINSDENYVLTRAFQSATQSTTVIENGDVIENITYFDGLGRPKQTIAIKQSPEKKDIITHIEYDALGRQVDDFLPYTSSQSNGSIQTGAKTATQQYYKAHYATDFPEITDVNSINAYSRKSLEASPLSRVEKQAAPGYDWRLGGGHEIAFDYQTNIANEVKLYVANVVLSSTVYNPTLSSDEFYTAGELYKTITKDENHDGTTSKLHTTEEFKNKQGQVVLKRTYALVDSNVAPHDTFYVYDDFGNLSYVLPPKTEANSTNITTTKLSELCYQYKYDTRNRLVEKKIPGKDWEYIVYDKLDRPVLTQDANLRARKQWLFTKYDHLGRVVYTGIYTHVSLVDQPAMQVHFNTQNNTANKYYETKLTTLGTKGVYYTNANFPINNTEILTVNYYDNYRFNRAGTATSANAYGIPSTDRLKGLSTGSRVKVLETDKWITTVTYYDTKARPIYVYSHNEYLGTTDIVESELDFVGKVLQTRMTHNKTGNQEIITVDDRFEYDHAARLEKQTQKVNKQAEEIIVENNYDALGQLESKKVGGGLQKIDYNYNVRGWLTNINDDTDTVDNDLFNFTLRYNKPTSTRVALYNGNISQTSWQTQNVDASRKTYDYSYDALNRIIEATGVEVNKYDVSGITYDKNGNILTLQRRGHIVKNPETNNESHFGLMDKLNYSYSNGGIGNKLLKVEELTGGNKTYGFKDGTNTNDDFVYDVNGNMTVDRNKGITQIDYNHLNLPIRIWKGSRRISYTYDASGVKLSKSVFIDGSTTITQYAGNYIYNKNIPPPFKGDDDGNPVLFSARNTSISGVNSVSVDKPFTLEFFNHPEGYVKVTNGSSSPVEMDYVYQYKDHLGNVRLSYTDNNKDGVIDAATEIIEESNYYPFGLKHKGYNVVRNIGIGNSTAQKFGYNGTELNESLGLNLHEMDFRQYDPAIARFTGIDPVTHFNQSTYTAFDNNPIYWADPSGSDSVQDLVGQMNPGVTYTNNGDGTFTGGDHTVGTKTDPQEGSSREGKKVVGYGHGAFAVSETQYYHAGNGGINTAGAKAGWYSAGEYANLFRKIIKDIGLGKGSIESLNEYGFTEEVLEFMEVWAYESIEYYTTHHDPMTLGNLHTDDFSSPFFIAAGFLKGLFVSNVVQQGANVSAKNMVFTLAEKKALKQATGYSTTRIVNGKGIITRFGIYNESSARQLNLIKEAFKRNGATSIRVYTNSTNDAMEALIQSRLKRPNGKLFTLSIKKRMFGGYILKGKL